MKLPSAIFESAVAILLGLNPNSISILGHNSRNRQYQLSKLLTRYLRTHSAADPLGNACKGRVRLFISVMFLCIVLLITISYVAQRYYATWLVRLDIVFAVLVLALESATLILLLLVLAFALVRQRFWPSLVPHDTDEIDARAIRTIAQRFSEAEIRIGLAKWKRQARSDLRTGTAIGAAFAIVALTPLATRIIPLTFPLMRDSVARSLEIMSGYIGASLLVALFPVIVYEHIGRMERGCDILSLAGESVSTGRPNKNHDRSNGITASRTSWKR